jgi:hypothetical protein
LQFEYNFCEVSGILFDISVILVPNCPETFFNAHHDSFFLFSNQLDDFLVDFGADLMV